jgi:hypothetical protein
MPGVRRLHFEVMHMSKTTLLKFLLMAFLYALGGEASLACMFGPPYRTVCETYAQADSVIIGKIESVEGNHLKQTVVIKVERTFKGQNRKEIVLSQPQSTCDWDFSDEVGKTLLLYLVRDKKTKKYSAIAEGMGGRVERENENLYWLNDLPRPLKRTRLSGEVRLYQDEPFEFTNSVAGVKVRVFNANNSFEVFTDNNGVYEIWDIPVGKYQIEPVIPPNLKLRFPLERGLVDFDSLKKNDPNTNAVLIEIQPKGCGGMDFVVNEKTDK